MIIGKTLSWGGGGGLLAKILINPVFWQHLLPYYQVPKMRPNQADWTPLEAPWFYSLWPSPQACTTRPPYDTVHWITGSLNMNRPSQAPWPVLEARQWCGEKEGLRAPPPLRYWAKVQFINLILSILKIVLHLTRSRQYCYVVCTYSSITCFLILDIADFRENHAFIPYWSVIRRYFWWGSKAASWNTCITRFPVWISLWLKGIHIWS